MNLQKQKSFNNDSSIENLQDIELLQCMICFEAFKEPKMLNCAHTFCSKCLEEYYSSYCGQRRAISGQIPCPNCRELTPWPANGVGGLRTDFKVQQIEDLLKAMSTQVQTTSSLNICGSCVAQNKKIQATSYCFSCEKSYCDSCTIKHSKNSLFNNHRVVTVSNNTRNETKDVMCGIHQVEDCKYLCRTCESLVCTLCLIHGHTKHEAVELKVAVKEQLENLKSYMNSINEKRDIFVSTLTELEPLMIQCRNACFNAEKLITSRAEKLLAEIKKQEAELLSQIKLTKETKISFLEGEVDRIKKSLSQIKGIEKLMAQNTLTPSKSFKTYELLIQRMSTIVEVDNRQNFKNLMANAILVSFIPSQETSINLGQLCDSTTKLCQSSSGPIARSDARQVGRPQHRNESRKLLLTTDVNFSPSGRSRSPNLRLIIELNKRGNQKGELNEPLWVTCLKNSNFVVSERGNKRLQIFDMKGKSQDIIAGQSMLPAGVAVTLKGNLIFADSNQKCIEIFTPGGKRLQRWGDGKFFLPCGVAVCPNGNIVISDIGNNTVSVYRNESNCIFVLGLSSQQEQQLNEPSYVTAGPHNEIIISDSSNHCVKIFDSKGKFLTRIGTRGLGDGEFNYPCGVCTDHEGNLIVADSGNDRVTMVTRNGLFLSHVLNRDQGIKSPRDVFFTTDGNLIVSESNTSRSSIKIFDMNGGHIN